jgi:hypothetical protein
MAAEVLARGDHADQVSPWVDRYIGRLDELPAPVQPVTDDNWRDALGDRVGDWAVCLTRQMAERPWRDVLATWWPRLLPGIAAGATHGVIRTGHAARTLLAGDKPGRNRRTRAPTRSRLPFWSAISSKAHAERARALRFPDGMNRCRRAQARPCGPRRSAHRAATARGT